MRPRKDCLSLSNEQLTLESKMVSEAHFSNKRNILLSLSLLLES